MTRAVLAEMLGTVLFASGVAVGFGYVLAVLTWPSVRRLLKKGARR